MALMEVNLLSGFIVPSDAIPLSDTVKKVESDQGKLNLYLDSVSSETCFIRVTIDRASISGVQSLPYFTHVFFKLLFQRFVSLSDFNTTTLYLFSLKRHHYRISFIKEHCY